MMEENGAIMAKMRSFLALATATLLGTAVVASQQAPPKAGSAAKPAASHASAAAGYMAVATVQDLMSGLIDPASKVVFTAVTSETTANGTVDKAPSNAAEWAVVRRSALMMVEGANLLLIPGRHITRTSARKTEGEAAAEGELKPSEIEIRVAHDRAAWNRFALRFREAALESLKAAEARKPDDFGPASESIDNACESCHLKFWYPEQEKLLANAPKPK